MGQGVLAVLGAACLQALLKAMLLKATTPPRCCPAAGAPAGPHRHHHEPQEWALGHRPSALRVVVVCSAGRMAKTHHQCPK